MNETPWTPGSTAPAAATPFSYEPGTSDLPDGLAPNDSYPGPALLFLCATDDTRWAAATVTSIAASWSSAGRRVVLADLFLEDPVLHEHLGEENSDGIVDIFLYGASVARSARPPEGQRFYLIPAGTYTASPEDVYRHERWAKLAAGFQDANATLLLFAPSSAPSVEALAEHTVSTVLLGRGGDGASLPVPADSLLAVLVAPGVSTDPLTAGPAAEGASAAETEVEPDDEPPEAAWGVTSSWEPDQRSADEYAAADAGVGELGSEEIESDEPTDEPSSWTVVAAEPAPVPEAERDEDEMPAEATEPRLAEPPHLSAPVAVVSASAPDAKPPVMPARRRKRHAGPGPLIWVLVGAGLLVGIVAAAAAVRPELFRGLFGSPAPNVNEPVGDLAPEPQPPPHAVVDTLPYTVQVRAFRTLAAARSDLTELQQRFSSESFYIVPELTQGVLYYKVMAGVLPDTASAIALRSRLVDAGFISPADARSDGPRNWSLIQQRPLTFEIGEFESRREAVASSEALVEQGVPAYPASIPYSDGSERWRLYGGAYAENVHADEMRQLLEEAGLPARLVVRVSRGRSDDP